MTTPEILETQAIDPVVAPVDAPAAAPAVAPTAMHVADAAAEPVVGPSPEVGAAATPSVPAAPAGTPHDGGTLTLTIAVLALITAVGSAFYMVQNMPTASKSELYVVDMPAIVEMRMSELVSEPTEMMQKKSEEFTKKLDDEIARLTKGGAVLLSPDAIVAGRDAIDATDLIAKNVGVSTSYDAFLKKRGAARARYNEQIAGQLRSAKPQVAAPNASSSPVETTHAPQNTQTLD